MYLIAFNVFHAMDLDFACRSLLHLCEFFSCWEEYYLLVLQNVNSYVCALCEK